MDFMKGWNMMQFFTGQKKSSESTRNKSVETSASEEAAHENEKLIKTKEAVDDPKDSVWTEKDTNDLMDIMESVLNIVKRKIELEQGNEENENERLEELVESVQAINDEINLVMMLISDITNESLNGDLESFLTITDLKKLDSSMGKVLDAAHDKTNYMKLISLSEKLLNIRNIKDSRQIKEQQTEIAISIYDNVESNVSKTVSRNCPGIKLEDPINLLPEDYCGKDGHFKSALMDDYEIEADEVIKTTTENNEQLTSPHIEEQKEVIYSNAYLSISLSKNQSETETLEPESPYPVQVKRANTMPLTYRSKYRRYLTRHLVELHRQSWHGDLQVVMEEEDVGREVIGKKEAEEEQKSPLEEYYSNLYK